ncbi:MAG TPA: tRNA adenylyltransferase [Pirellulales bacterium]
MPNTFLRQRIAFEAARLLTSREETEVQRARQKAARRVVRDAGGSLRRNDLPSLYEIREQVSLLTRGREGDAHDRSLHDRRLTALRAMRALADFFPRVLGGTLSGTAAADDDVELHLFADDALGVEERLAEMGLKFARLDDENASPSRPAPPEGAVQIRAFFEPALRLTIVPGEPPEETAPRPKPSALASAQPGAYATLDELEALLEWAYPFASLDDQLAEVDARPDRFAVFASLVGALENTRVDLKEHPEGDLLYHSLQVFELVKAERPYDEELLLAALLHDVGRAIDPLEPLSATVTALEGLITERTEWLIEHLPDAHLLREGRLGARAVKRLEASPDFDDLVLLAECDRRGRRKGGKAPDLDDALEFIRDLDDSDADYDDEERYHDDD